VLQAKKIDRAFEYVLLLIGVFVAGIFEFGAYLASEGVVDKHVPIFFFRALFSSFALLVLFWLASIFIEKIIYRIWFRLSAWAFGILILRLILVMFIGWSFLVPPIPESIIAFFIVSNASTFAAVLALYFVLRAYMFAFKDISSFRSKRWTLSLSLSWGFIAAINYGIVGVSIFEFVSATYDVFSGLLPMAIGLFLITRSFLGHISKNLEMLEEKT